MKEILKELTIAIKEMTTEFQKYNRPIIIVTDNPDCEMVAHYQKKGYPVYFPDWSKK